MPSATIIIRKVAGKCEPDIFAGCPRTILDSSSRPGPTGRERTINQPGRSVVPLNGFKGQHRQRSGFSESLFSLCHSSFLQPPRPGPSTVFLYQLQVAAKRRDASSSRTRDWIVTGASLISSVSLALIRWPRDHRQPASQSIRLSRRCTRGRSPRCTHARNHTCQTFSNATGLTVQPERSDRYARCWQRGRENQGQGWNDQDGGKETEEWR